jgi:sec-independent protein translocase protein TatC
MSLGQHLVELRKRLFVAALAVAIAAIGCWFLVDIVFNALKEPFGAITHTSGRLAELNFQTLTEAFDVRLQIALTLGVVVSSPVWLYQIWAFIVPALKRREKRYALGFLLTAIPLFFAGCYAGWLIFPHMVELLAGFAPQQTTTLVGVKGYVDFVMKLVLAVGVGFVLPVFLVLLNFIGIISGAAILKGWRIAILLITIFTAVVTPSADVLSMFLLAIPIVALYFGAAGVAFLHDRSVARREAALSSEIAA